MNIPMIKFPIWLELSKIILNIIGTKHKFVIVVTSDNYIEIDVLWGFFHLEKGEKKEFVIIGTKKYLEMVTSWLLKQNLHINKIIDKKL